VDYSKLASLEGQFLRVVHPETLADNSQRIRGRSVLLGDASEPQHRDHFNIGDLHPEPLSGVYLHACAVLTAAGAPLVELTAAAAAGLDVAFASAIAALIFFAAYKRPRQNWPLLIVCGLSIATGWLVSIAFIRFGRIVWMDLAPLTAGLFLYALVAGRVFRVAFDGNPSDRGRA
jgi:CHASE2 domain-containing sensor protein